MLKISEKSNKKHRTIKLAPKVFAVTNLVHTYGVNCGFVICDKFVVVIDAGWTIASAQYVLKQIRKYTQLAIKYVINTEWHSDHIFGNAIFKDAEIVAHSSVKRKLEQIKDYLALMKTKYPNVDFGPVKIILPTKLIGSDKFVLCQKPRIEILYTPGHLICNVSVWLPKTKILFASDTLYSGYNPTTVFGNKNLWKKWIKSLNKIKSLQPKIIVPGHGKILRSKAIEKEIQRNINYLKQKIGEK